jgi:hypothetical protein
VEPEEVNTDSAAPEDLENYQHLLTEYKKLKLDFDNITKVLTSGRSLTRLPPRPEPILQLEFDTEEESSRTEKPKKKAERSTYQL